MINRQDNFVKFGEYELKATSNDAIARLLVHKNGEEQERGG
jgi:hypothetical protein